MLVSSLSAAIATDLLITDGDRGDKPTHKGDTLVPVACKHPTISSRLRGGSVLHDSRIVGVEGRPALLLVLHAVAGKVCLSVPSILKFKRRCTCTPKLELLHPGLNIQHQG